MKNFFKKYQTLILALAALVIFGVGSAQAATLLSVPQGGTFKGSFTPYALITGGTTSTGALQNLASLGASGEVLTSNGAGVLPSFQTNVGAVSSVSNSDGTLTISPTTGVVVASLALAHANTWTGLQTMSISNTSTSGTFQGLVISPTYNQATGTAANTDLLIQRTQTAVGSGTQRLFDAQVGGSSKFSIDNNGAVVGNSTAVFSGAVTGAANSIFGTGTKIGSSTNYVQQVNGGAFNTAWQVVNTDGKIVLKLGGSLNVAGDMAMQARPDVNSNQGYFLYYSGEAPGTNGASLNIGIPQNNDGFPYITYGTSFGIQFKRGTGTTINGSGGIMLANSTMVGSTTAPSAILHVLGTTEQLRVAYDASNYHNFTIASDGTLIWGGAGTALTATSGTKNFVSMGGTFAPTSGTAIYDLVSLNPTINQTGGASGITRTLFLNPTLTAAADHRTLEIATGKSLFGGSVQVPIRTVTTSTTLTLNDYTILCDATSGNVVLTLPTAASSYDSTTKAGRTYNMKKIDASANSCKFAGSGGTETIDGATTYPAVGVTQYANTPIQSNGTAWYVE